MMERVKRHISFFAAAIVAVFLVGCANVKEMRITSFTVDSVVPQGFKSVHGKAVVGIDNPSVGFEVYNISGSIKRKGIEIGSYVLDPVSLKGKSSENYTVEGTMTLSQSITFFDILSYLSDFHSADYTADIRFTAKAKGMSARRFNLEDVPASKIVQTIKQKHL